MNNSEIQEMLNKIHRIDPRFDSDYSVREAAERCQFMDKFPEDYADGDYSAEELYDQLNTMRYGFEALCDIIKRM